MRAVLEQLSAEYEVRYWHRRDDRSSWRIGRLAGVKLTLLITAGRSSAADSSSVRSRFITERRRFIIASESADAGARPEASAASGT
jgi:hypothetical protein